MSAADDLSRKPWWVWRTHPSPKKRVTETVRYMLGRRERKKEQGVELELMLPYMVAPRGRVWSPDRSVGRVWPETRGKNNMAWESSVEIWANTATEFNTWFRGATRSDMRARENLSNIRMYPTQDFGSMLCVAMDDLYAIREGGARAQRYDYLLTPPMEMFCDLRGTFRFEDIGPLTFWIQPQIFEETGEIMQGAPVQQRMEEDPNAWGGIGNQNARFSISRQELAGESRMSQTPTEKRAMQVVMVALDSYLEHMRPDPRFVDPAKVGDMVEHEPF